jgi:hypothetical protein
MIQRGTLPAFEIDGRARIAPEAIRQAEAGTLAVRVVKRRRRETVPREVAELLAD